MGRGMIRSAFRNEEMAGDMPPGKLYTFYRMALQYYITQLKKVSRSVGCRRLTFNVARHTWATEARGMGVPDAAYQRRPGPHLGTDDAMLPGATRQRHGGPDQRKSHEAVLKKRERGKPP